MLSFAALASAAMLAPWKTFAAHPNSPWLIRGGVSLIDPKSDNGDLSAGAIEVDTGVGPSVNVAYFFTPNLAVDLLAALPFKHDFSINGQDAGSTKHLPPTLTLQYHFAPNATLQPYAGVGLNYTLFMDEDLDSSNELELDDSFGIALQVGVDVPLDARWRIGLDARYIDIESDAKVDGQDIGRIHIDPLVYSVNLGYRF